MVSWHLPLWLIKAEVVLTWLYFGIILIPHRFIVASTPIYRSVMSFEILAFVVFPNPMLWLCMIQHPSALQMSRDKFKREHKRENNTQQ